jgi:CDP-diacylglycerol--glycerol-3-phosphate 3-phosphatidyltransferase
MRLPLVLTFFRIFMSPLFVALYLFSETWGVPERVLPYLLIGIVALCELTDIFDGFFARRRNQVTNLGKVLDPMADSFFRLSVFFAFTQGELQLPLMVVLIFFWRDSLVNTLRSLCALQGIPLAARVSGKIKAVVQAVATLFILLLMIPYSTGCLSLQMFQQLSWIAAGVAAAYTFFSGCEYIFIHRHMIKKALTPHSTKK